MDYRLKTEGWRGLLALSGLMVLTLMIPNVASASEIDDRRFQRRAVEAAYWGMPT